ncbi:TRAP transporter small permease [Clostridiales bacterium COT073_COT-073]|nr:TRAP transporter small permease [Clostridiales bacterium COT073_COT-073]
MGILTASMIFSVIARYLFSLSWKQLTEFNVTTFAFTTFWGMGLCILNNEHVIIDIFYDKVPPHLKRWLTIFNYIVVLIVDIIFTIYAYKYTMMAGIQISQGMEISMKYMYGIMPVSGVICAICIIYKIVECIQAPDEFFAAKNIVLTNQVSEKTGGSK